jgi:hypothetical protein
MATPDTGEDIEDVCSRCGDCWHVVMAKVGEKIAKVVCKRCGSQHGYRGPNSAAEPAGAASATGKKVVKKRSTKSTPVVELKAPDFDPSKPPRPYSVRDIYQPGERILHPTFGTGVVATATAPGKVDVVFPAGARTLACGKAESTLARPVTIKNAPIGDRPPEK